MGSIPVEDRLAIEDVILAYGRAADTCHDLEAALAVFTEHAIYDLSGVGYPKFEGHAGISQFFTGAFEAMSQMAHYLTNISVSRVDGDSATASAYVQAMSRTKAGDKNVAYARYDMEFVRTEAGWKIAHLGLESLMP